MLIRSSKQTVSSVKHIIQIVGLLVSYTYLSTSADIDYPCEFHVASGEFNKVINYYLIHKKQVSEVTS